MSNRVWGEANRTVTLCIDSYNGAEARGRFYNPLFPDGKAVQSMTQFLLDMDRILNETDFPKAYTAARTFATPVGQCTDPPDKEFRMGDAATFSIRILFRQNASWQGSVTWLEGKQEQPFRSVLELLILIDSALLNVAAAS